MVISEQTRSVEDGTQKTDGAQEVDGAVADPPVTSASMSGPPAVWVALFLASFGVIFLWGSWQRDFWNPEEPRHALIASSMEATGDWLIPRQATTPDLRHPPLLYWLAAGSHAALRLDPRWSYRFPVALFAVLSLWLTYLAGRRLFDGRIGFLAATIQASTFLFFRHAGRLDDDLVFAVGCQLALTAFVIATRPGVSRGWLCLGHLGLAIAALSKSAPLAFVLVFGVLALYFFFDPDSGGVRRSLARLFSPAGVAVFLVLTGPWYAWVGYHEPARFFYVHVVGQHFARVFDAPSHSRLPHYYVMQILIGFLPWSIVLPLGLMHAKDRMVRPGERLVLFSILGPLVLLSLVSSKKPGYILFVWPALSLAVAAGLFEVRERYSVWEDYLRKYGVTVLAALLKVPLGVALVLVGFYYSGYLPDLVRISCGLDENNAKRVALILSGAHPGILPSAVLLGAGALCFLASRRVGRLTKEEEYPRAAFEFGTATLFVFLTISFLSVGANEVKSSRFFVEEIQNQVGSAPLGVYGYSRPAILYYLTRHSLHLPYPSPGLEVDPAVKALTAYLGRPRKVFLLAETSDYDKLCQLYSSLGEQLHVQARGHLGWTRAYVLLANQP